MSAIRGAIRPIRFELLSVAVLAGATILVAGGTVVGLLSFGIPTACWSGAGDCTGYARAIEEYQKFVEAWRGPALGAAVGLPVIAALLAGVALVGKEIDQRTTVLAWSMAPSRVRWLLLRVAPTVVLLTLFGLIAGGLVDFLASLEQPAVDQAHNFSGLGLRGLAIPGSCILVFGIALLVGSVAGRVLPALLLSAGLMVAAFVAISNVDDRLLFADSVIADAYEQGDSAIDSMLRTPEGEVIGWQAAYDRYGPQFDQFGPPPGFTQVFRILPGSLYPWAAARLALIDVAVGAFAIVGTFVVVVRRRRP